MPPERTPRPVMTAVRHGVTQSGKRARASCRRCGRTIVNIGTGEQQRWTHVAASGGLNVGCRASPFTTEDGWDDDLPRSWGAALWHARQSDDDVGDVLVGRFIAAKWLLPVQASSLLPTCPMGQADR